MQRIKLAPDYEISRVIRGGWQMATGHGQLKSDDPVADMVTFADAGITTFDCADIYTGVEELIGRFRLRYRDLSGEEALSRIKVHTKFVPDLDMLKRINKSYVESVIDQSLRRLNLDRLDLVQFHWWDYEAPMWLETAGWLNELRLAGKIHKVSATNFDTDRMLHMVNAGVPLTSMQVQYSLLDARPAKRMAEAATANNVALFCYGTVAGGFLGDRWLGQPEPDDFENRSLTKYKLIIDAMAVGDDRGRPQPLPPRLQPRHIGRLAHASGSRRDRRGAVSGKGTRRRRLYAGARPPRPPRPDHEIQPQQGSRLKHDPEKWEPGFGKDHAETKR